MESKKRKILALIVFFISFILIINLLKSIFNLLKAQERLEKSKQEVEKLEQENFALLEKEKHVGSNYFFEEQVRNKLGMARQGEKVILLPSPPSQSAEGSQKIDGAKKLAVWQQWWNTFFKNGF